MIPAWSNANGPSTELLGVVMTHWLNERRIAQGGYDRKSDYCQELRSHPRAATDFFSGKVGRDGTGFEPSALVLVYPWLNLPFHRQYSWGPAVSEEKTIGGEARESH